MQASDTKKTAQICGFSPYANGRWNPNCFPDLHMIIYDTHM